MDDADSLGRKLEASTSALGRLIGFVTAFNFTLLLFTDAQFRGGGGICDEANADSRASFSFLILLQVMANAPVVLAYFDAGVAQIRFGASDIGALLNESNNIKTSVYFYLAAIMMQLYVCIATLISGPFAPLALYTYLSLVLLLSAAAYTFVHRFGNVNKNMTF